jgi:predicted methyltransferase
MQTWLSVALMSALACGCTSGAETQRISWATPLSANVPRDLPPVTQSVADSQRALDVLAAPDRTADDRALDGPRQAADLLTYLDVQDGMNVVELAAGSGYFAELVARSVGHAGRLFAENPPSLVARHGIEDAWKRRLERPVGARMVRLDDELDKPLPTHAVDLVYVSDDLGDLSADGVRPGAGAGAAWNALRSGGRFVVVERAEAGGAPRADTVREIEQCGFHLVNQGRFFHDGARVALTFTKP